MKIDEILQEVYGIPKIVNSGDDNQDGGAIEFVIHSSENNNGPVSFSNKYVCLLTFRIKSVLLYPCEAGHIENESLSCFKGIYLKQNYKCLNFEQEIIIVTVSTDKSHTFIQEVSRNMSKDNLINNQKHEWDPKVLLKLL